MEPTHHEPWDTMHEAAHAYAVERLNEELDKHREAAGWIKILPETTEHVVAMMDAIGNQLRSVLNQVDRPTLLADDDKKVAERVGNPLLDIDAETDTALIEQPSAPKVYRINELGDIADPDVRQ